MLKKAFLRLVFPSFCISCCKQIEKNSPFCEDCIHGLVLSEPLEGKLIATTFEDHFISRVFVNYLKEQRYPNLIKTAAAYMALQFASLGWPMPSKIITCESSFLTRSLKKHFEKFLEKRNQESLLCICIEKNIKFFELIERLKSNGYELRSLSLL